MADDRGHAHAMDRRRSSQDVPPYLEGPDLCDLAPVDDLAHHGARHPSWRPDRPDARCAGHQGSRTGRPGRTSHGASTHRWIVIVRLTALRELAPLLPAYCPPGYGDLASDTCRTTYG